MNIRGWMLIKPLLNSLVYKDSPLSLSLSPFYTVCLYVMYMSKEVRSR